MPSLGGFYLPNQGWGNRLEREAVMARREFSEFEVLVGTAEWRGSERLVR